MLNFVCTLKKFQINTRTTCDVYDFKLTKYTHFLQGPLPPLGGGKSGGAGLKKLAPLRKSPSLKLSSSEKSSIESPNRRSNASPAKISEKTPPSSSMSPPKGSLDAKGLSLKLGGNYY